MPMSQEQIEPLVKNLLGAFDLFAELDMYSFPEESAST